MFEALLARLATELGRADIRYMVIGGQAVQLYGEPRMTKDIDITLGVGVESLDAVQEVVVRSGLRVLVAEPEKFVRETMVLPALDDATGIRVDLIFSFSAYEQQAVVRARPVELGSVTVNFASLEDVVVLKVIAGRPRDIEDVRVILLKNPDFDRKYIEHWLTEFDRSLDARYLDEFRGLAAEATQTPGQGRDVGHGSTGIGNAVR